MRLQQRRVLFSIALAIAWLGGLNYCFAQPGVTGTSGQFTVPAGGDYSTVDFGSSHLYGLDTTTGVDPDPAINTLASGSNGLNTSAKILMGTSSIPHTITFSWSSRAVNETFPFTNPGDPNSPLGLGEAENGLFSDVLTISGMGNGAGGTGPTDAFVLQMSYSQNAYIGTVHTTDPNNGNAPVTQTAPFNNAATGYPYSQLLTDQEISLWWLDPTGKSSTVPGWRPSVNGDSSVGQDAVNNFRGSFALFQSTYGVNPGNLTDFLGSNGVDDSDGNQVVWAVINHNSSFAVAPEPSSLVLAGMGSIFGGLIWMRRRRPSIR